MPTTFRPTVDYCDDTGGGVCYDPALAYDNDLSTYARVVAVSGGDYAAMGFRGFPADPDAAGRSAVTLRVNMVRGAWDATDKMFIYFRKDPGDSLALVGEYTEANLDPTAAWVDIDVTALAGSADTSAMEVAVQFGNSPNVNPPPPAEV